MPKEDDTGEDRTYLVWQHNCPCWKDCTKESWKRVKPKVKTFNDDPNVLKDAVAQHLLNSNLHDEINDYKTAMQIVIDYCDRRPNAIRKEIETFAHREEFRKWYSEASAKQQAPIAASNDKPSPSTKRKGNKSLASFSHVKEELDRGEVPEASFMMLSDDEEAPSHRIAKRARIGLKAVPFSPLDANMLAQEATRLELCGCNLKRACDGLFSAIDGTKANIAPETAFVVEHKETLVDLLSVAKDSAVALGKIGDGD